MRFLRSGLLVGAALAAGCVVPSTYRLAANDAVETEAVDAPIVDVGLDAGDAEMDVSDVGLDVASDVPDAGDVADAPPDGPPVDTTDVAVEVMETENIRFALTLTPSGRVAVPTDPTRPVQLRVAAGGLMGGPPPNTELELRIRPSLAGLRFTIGGMPLDANVFDLTPPENSVGVDIATNEETPAGTHRFTVEALSGSEVVARSMVDLELRLRPGTRDVSFGPVETSTRVTIPSASVGPVTLAAGVAATGGGVFAAGSLNPSGVLDSAALFGWRDDGTPITAAGWTAGFRSIGWNRANTASRSRITAVMPGTSAGAAFVTFGAGNDGTTGPVQTAAVSLRDMNGDAVAGTGDMGVSEGGRFVPPPFAAASRIVVATTFGTAGVPGGYLVVAQGTNRTPVNSPFIAVGRFGLDGSPDTSFGLPANNGWVNIQSALPTTFTSAEPTAIAASEVTGQILITFNGNVSSMGSAIIVRLNANGSLSTASQFGGSWFLSSPMSLLLDPAGSSFPGTVQIAAPVASMFRFRANALVWLPPGPMLATGRFYVIGSAFVSDQGRGYVLAIDDTDTDLNLDFIFRGFDMGGGILRGLKVFDCSSALGPSTDITSAVARRGGTGFVIAGGCTPSTTPSSPEVATIMTLTSDGNRDTNFAGAGPTMFQQRRLTDTATSRIEALATAPSGHLLAFATVVPIGASASARRLVQAIRLHLDDLPATP